MKLRPYTFREEDWIINPCWSPFDIWMIHSSYITLLMNAYPPFHEEIKSMWHVRLRRILTLCSRSLQLYLYLPTVLFFHNDIYWKVGPCIDTSTKILIYLAIIVYCVRVSHSIPLKQLGAQSIIWFMELQIFHKSWQTLWFMQLLHPQEMAFYWLIPMHWL